MLMHVTTEPANKCPVLSFYPQNVEALHEKNEIPLQRTTMSPNIGAQREIRQIALGINLIGRKLTPQVLMCWVALTMILERLGIENANTLL